MSLDQDQRRLYLRLLAQIRPYRGIFGGGLLAMVLLAITEAGIPAVLQPVLDGTFVDQDPFYLQWAPLAIVALFLFRGLFGFASAAALAAVNTKMVYDLRKAMFASLVQLPNSRLDQVPSGSLVSKLTYDVNQLTQTASQVITVLVRDSVTVLALLGYVFWLDWQLSLVVFVLVPVIAGVALVVGRRLRRLNKVLQNSFGHITHVLEELARNHRVVKIFLGRQREQARFLQAAKDLRQFQFKTQISAAAGVPIVELFGALIMAAVIYIGTSPTQDEQMSVGTFVAFFTALGLLFSPIKRLTKINDPLQRGLAAAESIYDLIDERCEPDTGTKTLAECRGHIRFEDVRFRYPGADHVALDGISFTAEPGQLIALVGTSGSGKTTAANLLPRLYELDNGRILIDDVDIRDLSLESLRQQISYVGQEVTLFNDTVAANIAYGVDRPEQADIERAAKLAQADAFIRALPHGYETEIGENGILLSGGQRQRLAIARALYKDSPVLILDEATSALDTSSEKLVQQALENLEQGRTTLVIAHRLSTIQKADCILVFDHGRIVETGSHEQLLARHGAYFSFHQTVE